MLPPLEYPSAGAPRGILPVVQPVEKHSDRSALSRSIPCVKASHNKLVWREVLEGKCEQHAVQVSTSLLFLCQAWWCKTHCLRVRAQNPNTHHKPYYLHVGSVKLEALFRDYIFQCSIYFCEDHSPLKEHTGKQE